MRCKKTKILAAIAIIVFISVFWVGIYTTRAATESSEQTSLVLSKENSDDEVRFTVGNMLPGDNVEQDYQLEVYHTGNIKLRFKVDIKNGSEILAEVLNCRVSVLNDKELYNGLMSKMPSELIYELDSEKAVKQTVVYLIDVYLDSAVGNKYQEESLTADFCWWVEEKGSLNPNPDTSNSTGVMFLVAICISILVAVIAIVIRKKETKETTCDASEKQKMIIQSLSLLIIAVMCSYSVIFALNKSKIVVDNNKFVTGTIAINLNDGDPIIGTNTATLEPGVTILDSFFVENTGSNDAYYRIRIENLYDDMADLIYITITEDTNVLYRGPMSNLFSDETEFPWKFISAGEVIYLNISLTLSENCGNEASGRKIEFSAVADAIQTKALNKK